MRNAIIALVVIVAVGVLLYFFTATRDDSVERPENGQEQDDVAADGERDQPERRELDGEDNAADATGESVIGTSAAGHDITAHHFGDGETEVLFVGGIHGGYAWNTALVAFELVEYLEEDPDVVPEGVRVTVVPVLNPDGLEEVVGTTGRFDADEVPTTQAATVPGRFNANNVDLNRNFDCDWQASATWQDQTVSGGDAAFSEPEAQAIRAYIGQREPDAVVVYYSAAGGVFASNCHEGVLPETRELTNIYAEASGYPAFAEFDFYEITGDMVNWLARENVPAISVLLSTHQDVEWAMNRAGVEALLEFYASEGDEGEESDAAVADEEDDV